MCFECSYELRGANMRIDIYDVSKLIEKYGGILLNKEEYTGFNDKNLLITCYECGKPFFTSLNSYIKHGGQRCNNCSSNESKGEYAIRMFLEMYNIN